MIRRIAMLAAFLLGMGAAASAATVSAPMPGDGRFPAARSWPDGVLLPWAWAAAYGPGGPRADRGHAAEVLLRLLSDRSRILAFYAGRGPDAVPVAGPGPVPWRFLAVAGVRERGILWIGAFARASADMRPGRPSSAPPARGPAGALPGTGAVTPVSLKPAAAYLVGALLLIGAAGRWHRTRR